jgi:ribonuclease P protein component
MSLPPSPQLVVLSLTRTPDFQRIRQHGRSCAAPALVLVSLPAPLFAVRVGFVCTRTVGGAVQRNRAKRLLRAAMQQLANSFVPGWEVVLIARQPIVQLKLVDVQQQLQQLLQRARLLHTMPGDRR